MCAHAQARKTTCEDEREQGSTLGNASRLYEPRAKRVSHVYKSFTCTQYVKLHTCALSTSFAIKHCMLPCPLHMFNPSQLLTRILTHPHSHATRTTMIDAHSETALTNINLRWGGERNLVVKDRRANPQSNVPNLLRCCNVA